VATFDRARQTPVAAAVGVRCATMMRWPANYACWWKANAKGRTPLQAAQGIGFS